MYVHICGAGRPPPACVTIVRKQCASYIQTYLHLRFLRYPVSRPIRIHRLAIPPRSNYTVAPTFQPLEFAQAASSKASLRDRPQFRHAKILHSLELRASEPGLWIVKTGLRMPRMNMARVETPPRRAASRAFTAQCVSKTCIDPKASSPHSKQLLVVPRPLSTTRGPFQVPSFFYVSPRSSLHVHLYCTPYALFLHPEGVTPSWHTH